MGAKCGRCGEKLFQARPMEVDGEALSAHLRGSRGLAILLDVWAPWCGPCRMMAPQFTSAAGRLEPDVRLLKLDSEANPQAATELRVSGIPTLILFRDGREIARQAGAMSAGQIVAWTRQALAQAPA
jgi:thioredoxin 2